MRQVMSGSATLMTMLLAAAPGVHAAVFLSVEQAQSSMFPGASFSPVAVTLTDAQIGEIQKRSGQRVPSRQLKAWKASTGGWFIVDQVIGKHEYIPYAVGLDAVGGVKQVEILEYRESYGEQVRNPAWRAQFVGKRADAPLKLGADIRNISGATLSSKHVADGVKRILATHAVALANS